MTNTATPTTTMSSPVDVLLIILTKSPITTAIIALSLFTFAILPIYRLASKKILEKRCYPSARFPVATLPGLDPVTSFKTKGVQLLLHTVEQQGYRPFQVIGPQGPKILLPYTLANEVKSAPEFSFSDAEKAQFMLDAPEFLSLHALFNDNSLVPKVCLKLTQSLGVITQAVASETTLAFRKHFPTTNEWQLVDIEHTIEDAVACISSRAFVGKVLSRNEQWLGILRRHVYDVFTFANVMKYTHPALRLYKRWTDPLSKRLGQQYREAGALLGPEIDKRRLQIAKAKEAGVKGPKLVDTLVWMLEIKPTAKVEEVVASQMAINIAAVHTTTLTAFFLVMDLCANPEFIAPLREEMIKVLSEEGGGDPKKMWTRKTIQQLKLLDSAIRESQRVHPISFIPMNRACRSDVTLSDGTFLRKGSIFHIMPPYLDPTLYPNPTKFDPYRFLRKAEAGEGALVQLATTTPEHPAFGHGKHACPGRFFASDELKIALTHLLLKYDFELRDEEKENPNFSYDREACETPNRGYTIRMRRRQEEIGIDIEDEDNS